MSAEESALIACYNGEEIEETEEQKGDRRNAMIKQVVLTIMVMVMGWYLYYSYGSVAVFLYGMFVTAAHYLHCVYLQRLTDTAPPPHPLTTLAFINCLVLLVVYVSLTTHKEKEWLVTWNGVISGYATSAFVLAFAVIAKDPAAAVGIDANVLAIYPHIGHVARVAIYGFAAIIFLSNVVGTILIAEFHVNPNAPMYTNVATVIYNWCGSFLTLPWIAFVKLYLAPRYEKAFPRRSFDEFLDERKRRNLPPLIATSTDPAPDPDAGAS